RVLRTDLYDLLTVCDRRLLDAFEIDIALDEFDRAICTGRYGLHRGAGEPVDHRATGDQTEHERSMQNRKILRVDRKSIRERHDDREDHRCRTDDSRTDQHRLCAGLECIARTVILFEQMFATIELHIDIEIALEL